MCVDEENKMKENSKKKVNDPRNSISSQKANRSLPIF